MVDKLQTDISVNPGLTWETRAGVTPGKTNSRNKENIKSLAMYPPRKDPITYQDKNTLWLQKDQCLPPHVPQFSPEFK